MRTDGQKNFDRILAVARTVVTREGVNASLRDIARKAGVGLGTLYRHFPTREALLEALLRANFDELAARATDLETSVSPADALVSWIRETVVVAHRLRGVTTAMMAAIEDSDSALHSSCVAMRSAGGRLLARAQDQGMARRDVDAADLFALIAALAWLRDQPSHSPRADHILGVIADAILTSRESSNAKKSDRHRGLRK
jgi:AcrR family transcriptional regulator